jgi:hypothetical protein
MKCPTQANPERENAVWWFPETGRKGEWNELVVGTGFHLGVMKIF